MWGWCCGPALPHPGGPTHPGGLPGRSPSRQGCRGDGCPPAASTPSQTPAPPPTLLQLDRPVDHHFYNTAGDTEAKEGQLWTASLLQFAWPGECWVGCSGGPTLRGQLPSPPGHGLTREASPAPFLDHTLSRSRQTITFSLAYNRPGPPTFSTPVPLTWIPRSLRGTCLGP